MKYQMDWFDDCAYFGTTNNPLVRRPGVVVVDATNPNHPRQHPHKNNLRHLDRPTRRHPAGCAVTGNV